MHHRPPASLVKACRKGQPEAWDELLEGYGRLIWSVALRLGARGDEAEEVFQRTWVAIVEGIHKLREPTRLASWIAGTARHQTYRKFAETGRQRRHSSLEEQREQGLDPAVLPDHDEALQRIEEQAALHDAMGRLGERCRVLLDLLFFHDPPLDYGAISEVTGLAVGSIGPIRARCLKRLRKILGDLYHGLDHGDP